MTLAGVLSKDFILDSAVYEIKPSGKFDDNLLSELTLRRRLELVKATKSEIKYVMKQAATKQDIASLQPVADACKNYQSSFDKLSKDQQKVFIEISNGKGYSYYHGETPSSLYYNCSGFIDKLTIFQNSKEQLSLSYYSYLMSGFNKVMLKDFQFAYKDEKDVTFFKDHPDVITIMSTLLVELDKLNGVSVALTDSKAAKDLDELIKASASIKAGTPSTPIANETSSSSGLF